MEDMPMLQPICGISALAVPDDISRRRRKLNGPRALRTAIVAVVHRSLHRFLCSNDLNLNQTTLAGVGVGLTCKLTRLMHGSEFFSTSNLHFDSFQVGGGCGAVVPLS